IYRRNQLGHKPNRRAAIQVVVQYELRFFQFIVLRSGLQNRLGRKCDRLAAKPGQPQHVLELERSEEHTSELQSLMRISYAVLCLTKKNSKHTKQHTTID